ncbi:hypothetical protein [Litorihabitans aurantiacus]|uniref:Hemagglutinin n=1 Tax=Litorihabitans aurantiacus TaxID=1930061 RepID=A0AA37UUM7_9MICO|nr:hypothetical protein [Litorihabitans aurantiacus]GMA30621.1 hypothetical protein GCM10025875_06130 [Litorihabitans aurantiacus]
MIVAIIGIVSALAAPPARADLSGFDPGYIISDEVFYNPGTMTAADIQRFLDARGASCRPNADGTACLRSYRQTTNDRTADQYCPGGYRGASDESAATIIAKVAASCRINPQVLLVTLQKEQTLVTRTTAGSARTYDIALGFGCPDGAPCQTQYFGFANQTYNAARQFQRYRAHPTNYSYRAGRENFIGYHPNASLGCGGSSVFIRNDATAGLYNYTPYQPNAAALRAGYGTGDACSAYGNRNFYLFFNDWFGGPQAGGLAGSLTSVVQSGPNRVRVQGWALDRGTPNPVDVRVLVDGAATDVRADRPGAPEGHGSSRSYAVAHDVSAPPGLRRVCLVAIAPGGGANAPLGCRDVTVLAQPVGAVDPIRVEQGGRATVSGWALDPDSSAPVTVRVVVDDRVTETVADRPAPGRTDRVGFSANVTAQAGSRRVCVLVGDDAGAPGVLLSCQDVTFR